MRTGDAIDRHAAIEIAKGHWYKPDIAGALAELPSAQPERWIPCSERPPEESGYYIVTAHDGVSHRTTFVKYQKKAKSWDLTGARSYWRVIAWMPLPSPYKGEQSMKTKVCIRFKSGFELPITCDSFKVNTVCGEISSYDIVGIEDNKPLYFRPEEVECIYRKLNEGQE